MLCLHLFPGPGTENMVNKYLLNECSVVILRSLGVILRAVRNHRYYKRGNDFIRVFALESSLFFSFSFFSFFSFILQTLVSRADFQ